MVTLPMVNDPISSVSSTLILLTALDGLPRDHGDKHIELALHHDFKASASSLKASSARTGWNDGRHGQK